MDLAGRKQEWLFGVAVDSGILGTCLAYFQRSSATSWTFEEISRGSKMREIEDSSIEKEERQACEAWQFLSPKRRFL